MVLKDGRNRQVGFPLPGHRLYITVRWWIMQPLSSFQAKYLRGLAHGLKPVVFVGQKGATASLLDSIREALNAHELIKAKFIDFKDRRMKAELVAEIAQQTGSRVAGLIGHTAILYRPHPDPEKRRIVIPAKGA
jgi:RNA-binding protein